MVKYFTKPDIKSGILYFYIHLVTETVCFYCLSNIIGDSIVLWLIPLIYDAMAFVPQSIIGYMSDKNKKINFSLIGIIMLATSIIIFSFKIKYIIIPLLILCIGNCFLHVNGAKITLNISDGKLSPSAIFVSGGSFGVIIGKLLSMYAVDWIFVFILCLTAIPYIVYSEYIYNNEENKNCEKFNYATEKVNKSIIVVLAVFIVIVRGYMGYGIPTSWNKTIFQTILLYVCMGFGKALGGILSDLYGMKKIAIGSTLFAIPFLAFGDNFMLISLIGVMFFSMTMAITLGILVSVLKRTPCLAFGLTTIGLFLGTISIFIFKINSTLTNIVMISILSILCACIFKKIIRGGFDG